MKRVWIAILFLSICTGVCVCEQIYVTKTYNTLNKKIATAQDEPSEENIKDLISYYKEQEKYLFSMCESERLIELNQAIHSLSHEDKNIKIELSRARSTNDNFYDETVLRLANIL